jgi:hypothetical protein
VLTLRCFERSQQEDQTAHASLPSPESAADMLPIVTDTFIQCKNVRSLAVARSDNEGTYENNSGQAYDPQLTYGRNEQGFRNASLHPRLCTWDIHDKVDATKCSCFEHMQPHADALQRVLSVCLSWCCMLSHVHTPK